MKIGVILPLGTRADVPHPLRYRTVRAMALQAEEAGFDSVWIYDHLIYRAPVDPPGGVWEAWTVFSALAEATTRVELGALVMCTAFRNPAVLAKMAATFDEVSDGRLILGLGAGWHQPEFDAFGIPFDHLVDRFEEALEIIVPLLRDGAVDFTGEHYRAPDCELLPRPARRIPVLVAAFKPRMLRLTARYADRWNTAWHGRVDAIAANRAALEAACAEVGRDPATLQVTAGVSIAYPELGEVPAASGNPDKFLTGGPAAIAAGLRGYAEAGVGHVICAPYPMTPEALNRLGEALAVYRGSSEPRQKGDA